MQIAGGVLFVFNETPAEEFVIEAPGRGGIGRAQIGPAKSAILADNANAFVLFRLPDRKHCSRGIGNYGHASSIHHIEGWSAEPTTDFGCVTACIVCVLNSDVEHPMRWNALRAFLALHRVCRGRVLTT